MQELVTNLGERLISGCFFLSTNTYRFNWVNYAFCCRALFSKDASLEMRSRFW